MKVLFWGFYNELEVDILSGIGVLSSALKSKGHQTRETAQMTIDFLAAS